VRCENAIDNGGGYTQETLFGIWMKPWRDAQIKVRRG